MSLGTSARKIVRRRVDQAHAEAKRVREATWDGSFWLLPQWNELPIVERLAHVCEFMRHTRRDAFIPTFCRRYAGANWGIKSDLVGWWREQTIDLYYEYFRVVLNDEQLLNEFAQRDPESFDKLARRAEAWLERNGNAAIERRRK